MSKFENYVISVLKEIVPAGLFLREVSVKKLFPEYPSHRDRYDIVLKNLHIIIECHGKQHMTPTSFGTQETADVIRNFATQKFRDFEKQNIAEKNNWSYVIIWYNEITNNFDKDIEIIKKKIMESI